MLADMHCYCGHVIENNYLPACAQKHTFNTRRVEWLLTMKVVVVLVLAVVAAADAKFQFTEEWELWKRVPPPGLAFHFRLML